MEKVIDLGGFSHTVTNGYAEPFTIAFIYTPTTNFVIKGMASAVQDELKKYPKSVHYLSFWKGGLSRGFWGSTSNNIRFWGREQNGRYKKQVCLRNSAGETKEMIFRRIPRKWLPEYEFAFS